MARYSKFFASLSLPLRLAIVAGIVLALTGCQSTGLNRAADAYDQSLVTAEAWMCRASSVGSVVRAYGASPDQWQAWLTLCGYSRSDQLAAPKADFWEDFSLE